MKWVKLHTDVLNDPKLMRAERKGRRGLVLLPWLLAFAGEADDAGRLTVNGEPAEPVDIAAGIPGESARTVAVALASCEAIGVLVRDADNALRFARWAERAGKPSDRPESARERKQRQREKARAEQLEQERAERATSRDDGGSADSANVTPGHAGQGVTGHAGRHAIEGEGEGEEEGENYSCRTEGPCDVSEATAADATKPTATDQPEVGDHPPELASLPYPAAFEALWAVYPARTGGNSKRKAHKAWAARLRAGVSADAMASGVARYAAYCEATNKRGTEFVQLCATFLGPDEHWADEWAIPTAATVSGRKAVSPAEQRATEIYNLGHDLGIWYALPTQVHGLLATLEAQGKLRDRAGFIRVMDRLEFPKMSTFAEPQWAVNYIVGRAAEVLNAA